MNLFSGISDWQHEKDLKNTNKYLDGKHTWDALSKDEKYNVREYIIGAITANVIFTTMLIIIGYVLLNYSFVIECVGR